MTTRILVAFAMACALVLAAGSAWCQPRWGVEAHGGWCRMTMDDVNDSLSSLNRQIGTRFESIEGGTSWGLALRAWVRDDVLLRFGYERLMTASEDSGVHFGVDANSFTLGATWWTRREHRVRYGVGATFGLQTAAGRLGFDGGAFGTSGSGFGGTATAEAMVPLRGGWSLGTAIGYRHAHIANLRFGASTSQLRADYSGPFLRIGLAIDGDEPRNALPQ